jgi:hypothetical protein
MSTKMGAFSDGGHRIRAVTSGNAADPAPSDPRHIIFDSDWPEILLTASGYFGTATVLESSSYSGSVSFTTLPFTPLVYQAENFPDNYPNIGSGASQLCGTMLYSALSGAYESTPVPSVTSAGATLTARISAIYGPNPDPTSVSLGWAAFLVATDATPPSVGSRTGTTYMTLTADGPAVAKPGKSALSTAVSDFLIPPSGLGAVLGQPFMAGTVTSLSLYQAYTITITGSGSEQQQDYAVVINHGLGYIPIFVTTASYDFRDTSLLLPNIWVDENNIYIWATARYTGTPPSTKDCYPVSYFLLRKQWF